MALVKSRAVVLRTYRLGETSKVVVCYTRDYGKVRLVAKGVRKGGGRLGSALEPMRVSGVVFYLRSGRDLSLVSQAEIEREWSALRRDVVRLTYASVALELIDALVTEREPDPGLFDLIEGLLDTVAEAEEADLDATLWTFELSLARALGYTPDFSRCVVCGGPPGEDALFVPRDGGAVCARCAADRRDAPAVSGRALEVLSALAGGALDEARRQMSPAVRDEISEALRVFLEEHSGRRLALKSADVLSQLRRAEPSEGGAEQNHDQV